MSDLFHKDVPDDYIERVARVMAAGRLAHLPGADQAAERMRDLLRTRLAFAANSPHIWWGVSVENRKHGLPRIDALREAPAAVRFLSVEPLLEDLGELNLNGIDWVIVGGESGPGARPMTRNGCVGHPRPVPRPARCRSSSSSGAACASPRRAASWTAGPTTRCPCRQPAACSPPRPAGMIEDVRSWTADLQSA